MLKATNIQWVIDEPADGLDLPSEVEIPEEFSHDEEQISDYLSDLTGFLHEGFSLEAQPSRA